METRRGGIHEILGKSPTKMEKIGVGEGGMERRRAPKEKRERGERRGKGQRVRK